MQREQISASSFRFDCRVAGAVRASQRTVLLLLLRGLSEFSLRRLDIRSQAMQNTSRPPLYRYTFTIATDCLPIWHVCRHQFCRALSGRQSCRILPRASRRRGLLWVSSTWSVSDSKISTEPPRHSICPNTGISGLAGHISLAFTTLASIAAIAIAPSSAPVTLLNTLIQADAYAVSYYYAGQSVDRC